MTAATPTKATNTENYDIPEPPNESVVYGDGSFVLALPWCVQGFPRNPGLEPHELSQVFHTEQAPNEAQGGLYLHND